MFKNLTVKEKEERFNGLINFALKIENSSLRNVCTQILNDYKELIYSRSAGDDGVENIKRC